MSFFTSVTFPKNKILYYKVYSYGREFRFKSNHHTITEEQVDNLVNMLNSKNEKDVDLALSIMKKSNCNKNYESVIFGALKGEWVDNKKFNNHWMTRTIYV